MSNYTSQDNYWNPTPQVQYNFDTGFEQPNQLEFQTYTDQNTEYPSYTRKSFFDPTSNHNTNDAFAQNDFTKDSMDLGDEDSEPPLLEELGINPDRIMQKTLAVLNPFHRTGQIDDADYLLQDSDLAGPVSFSLALAAFLLLAGSKAHFGYVYGLAMMSCFSMYMLQFLMSSTSTITLTSVASVLGYCLLPIVMLAGLGVFTEFKGSVGLVIVGLAVAWSTLSASRLFSTMSGEKNQRLLIAYPCFLLYGVFTLIVVF